MIGSRFGARGWIGFALLSCASAGSQERALEVGGGAGDLRQLVAEFQADRGALGRFYEGEGSPVRLTRLRAWVADWRARLDAADFDALDQDGRIDWLLLGTELDGELVALAREERDATEEAPLVP